IMTGPLTVRPLSDDDADASRRLGWEAFGVPAQVPETPATLGGSGQYWYGAFDGDSLVGRVAVHTHSAYFGGRAVASAGIAGVTVAAEYRGRGLLTPLFAMALGEARGRGVAVSGLYPTATGIYRRFGYEVVGSLDNWAWPTESLAAVRVPDGVTIRRATTEDVPALWELYEAWAVEQNGPLSHRSVAFEESPNDWLDEVTAVTVAVDGDDRPHGYVRWNRGRRYGPESKLEVYDLIADSAPVHQALLAALGSFSTVTGTTEIMTSGLDHNRFLLPGGEPRLTEARPYMIAILDLAGAVEPRAYPGFLNQELELRVAGDRYGVIDGGYRITVAGGKARCVRADAATGPIFTPRGLALVYAGVASCADLRRLGLLTGPVEQDQLIDVVFAGRPFHIRDYY
ncbi:MAG: GNAT family N-acetyltransferase, partial [Stackebrandtia sp.]